MSGLEGSSPGFLPQQPCVQPNKVQLPATCSRHVILLAWAGDSQALEGRKEALHPTRRQQGRSRGTIRHSPWCYRACNRLLICMGWCAMAHGANCARACGRGKVPATCWLLISDTCDQSSLWRIPLSFHPSKYLAAEVHSRHAGQVCSAAPICFPQ